MVRKTTPGSEPGSFEKFFCTWGFSIFLTSVFPLYYAYTLSYTIFLHNTGTCKQRKGASMVYWIPHLQKMQERCFLSKNKRPKNYVNDKILHLKHSWSTLSEFKKLFLRYRQGPFPLIKHCDWSRHKSMKNNISMILIVPDWRYGYCHKCPHSLMNNFVCVFVCVQNVLSAFFSFLVMFNSLWHSEVMDTLNVP